MNFLIECKCLFLRTRTPSKSIIQYVIQGFWPDYLINSKNSRETMSKALSNFNSWRFAFNAKLMAVAIKLVTELE